MSLQELRDLLALVEDRREDFTGKTEHGVPGAQVWQDLRANLIDQINAMENSR